jgi:lactoylglutathione lyase
MTKTIHAMIRVLDEARSVAFYERAFGLAIADRLVFDGFTLIYLRNAETPFELELTVNHGRTEPYQLGDGYGHLAISVADLDAAHARMSSAGGAPGPIRTLAHEGNPFARFFFVKDPDGYSIEVLQRGGRFA